MKTKICVLIALLAFGTLLQLHTGFSAGLLQTNVTLPFSGVVQQTLPETFSYIISVSGANYQMADGTTGQIKCQSTNATQVMNIAIGNLTQGGNILIKTGTYNLRGSITATHINDINLHFEEGAILFVSNGMNAPAIILNACNNWLIQSPTINGNLANQAVATGSGGTGMVEYGILINIGSNNRIDDANITNCGQTGVVFAGTGNYLTDHNSLTNSKITYCGWNGLTVDSINHAYPLFVTNTQIINNEFAYFGDVGISTYGAFSNIQNNYVHDMNGTLGYNNARYGIAVEGGGNNTIIENIVANCVIGIHVDVGYTFNTITLNTVGHCEFGIHVSSDYNIIESNKIVDYDYLNHGDQAIIVTLANHNQILTNVINGTYAKCYAIYVGICTDTQIIGNSIVSTATQDWSNIVIANSNRTHIEQNWITGVFGITIEQSSCLNTVIQNNDVSQCSGTKISDTGTATSIFGNVGYNPIGSIASPVRGNLIVDSGSSSIWVSGTSYMNWESPKVLRLSGGIVTVIAVNGQTLFNETTTIVITLQPGDTFSVTFSSAPTITVSGQ